MKKKILMIIEIIILLYGIMCSITTTAKTLKYTHKYVWCFTFAILGVVFIGILIRKFKEKYICLIGVGLILAYLFLAGSGAVICEMNSARLNRISWYKGKSVEVIIDDSEYEWDGESVTYDSQNLEYYDGEIKGEHLVRIFVDGEEKNNNILINSNDDSIYLEITGGGTGIYLILKPKG